MFYLCTKLRHLGEKILYLRNKNCHRCGKIRDLCRKIRYLGEKFAAEFVTLVERFATEEAEFVTLVKKFVISEERIIMYLKKDSLHQWADSLRNGRIRYLVQ